MAFKRLNLASILILLVGAFLLLNGIADLSGNDDERGGVAYNISRAFGSSSDTITIILAVIEIIAGGLLIISRFVSIGVLDRILRVGLLILWIVVMVFALILGGNMDGIDTLAWWISLINYSIILVILWKIKE